jgi:hypothetical protein
MSKASLNAGRMAKPPVLITLTSAQRTLIRQTLGKSIAKLHVEPVDSGSGWLYSAKGNQFWLLKHADPESYLAARQNQQRRIDPRHSLFHLRVGRSRIHRWGVYAAESIPARRNVIEYVGELVNPVESYWRTKHAKQVYTFKLSEFWRIDGSVGGSGAELINHSCDPNLRSRVLGNRIVYQSVRAIAGGEELTVDYHFSPRAPRVACCCASPKCRGTINVRKDSRSRFRSPG